MLNTVNLLRARPSAVRATRGKAVRVAASAVSAKDLNKKFGIPEHVRVVEGNGGLPTVILQHSSGATAQIYLYGACITSWTQANGSEVLYVRPDAVFDGKKPISGGVPLCFPQFGPGAIQQHGFARNLNWSIASTSADPQPDERDPSVELVLEESDYTRAMWPHKFKVVYTITLHGEELRTDFRVINTDDKPFDFTAALHTYFEVLGIDKARVKGLKGLSYLDKAADGKNPPTKKEDAEWMTFPAKLVDSVYLNAPDYQELDVGTGAAVAITGNNWSDVVVWNPYTTMESCYKNFCCVEKAQTSKAVTVQPGKDWRATMNLSVVNL